MQRGNRLRNSNPKPKTRGNQDVDELSSSVDHVVGNASSSHYEAQLYIFEDNEVVIKMIIKGRTQRGYACPEPTELRWIGCLTESTWTQNPNQIC